MLVLPGMFIGPSQSENRLTFDNPFINPSVYSAFPLTFMPMILSLYSKMKSDRRVGSNLSFPIILGRAVLMTVSMYRLADWDARAWPVSKKKANKLFNWKCWLVKSCDKIKAMCQPFRWL